MIALFAVLLSLTAAAALSGDYPWPLDLDRDFEDDMRMSWWDEQRSMIDDHRPAPGQRTPKVGLDIHAAACAGHDGTDFECVCGLLDEMGSAMIWREPAEESVDLYPGLVLHDGRVSGSITTGVSRLPLWAFVTTAIHGTWEDVEDGWSPTENYGWTADDLSGFLYDLLEARGEFGRLLLVLADAERVEHEREEADSEAHWNAAHPGETVCDCGRPWPKAWWEQPDLRDRVRDQLRRCLDVLDGKDQP